jgi:hypothetical protein
MSVDDAQEVAAGHSKLKRSPVVTSTLSPIARLADCARVASS